MSEYNDDAHEEIPVEEEYAEEEQEIAPKELSGRKIGGIRNLIIASLIAVGLGAAAERFFIHNPNDAKALKAHQDLAAQYGKDTTARNDIISSQSGTIEQKNETIEEKDKEINSVRNKYDAILDENRQLIKQMDSAQATLKASAALTEEQVNDLVK